MVQEGTDFQMYVWRSVLFVMPSMRSCQSLQSTYEKNYKSFLPSAFSDPKYLV